MIRIIYLFLFLIFFTGCSFNKNSKFWTSSKEIKIEKNFREILKKNENINEELNPNFRIKLDKLSSFSYSNKQLNNFDLPKKPYLHFFRRLKFIEIM